MDVQRLSATGAYKDFSMETRSVPGLDPDHTADLYLKLNEATFSGKTEVRAFVCRLAAWVEAPIVAPSARAGWRCTVRLRLRELGGLTTTVRLRELGGLTTPHTPGSCVWGRPGRRVCRSGVPGLAAPHLFPLDTTTPPPTILPSH